MTRSLATDESRNNDQDGNGLRVIVPTTVVVRGLAPMPPAHPGAPRANDAEAGFSSRAGAGRRKGDTPAPDYEYRHHVIERASG